MRINQILNDQSVVEFEWKGMNFPSSSGSLDGIIKYLTTHNRTLINAESSSHIVDKTNWGDAKVLLDFSLTASNHSHNFCSDYEELTNVTFHFFKKKVYLQSYTILSRTKDVRDMLRGWHIYGSNNNRTWHYIDDRGPCDDLVSVSAKKTYTVKRPGAYRSIRLVQTSPNSSESYYLVFCKIEFFGKLLNYFGIITSRARPIICDIIPMSLLLINICYS